MNSIFKYLPFDALEGHHQKILETKKEYEKIDRPIISEDMVDEINYNIIRAIHENLIIKITYFYNGVIKEIAGIIMKINECRIYFSKYIFLNKIDILYTEVMI